MGGSHLTAAAAAVVAISLHNASLGKACGWLPAGCFPEGGTGAEVGASAGSLNTALSWPGVGVGSMHPTWLWLLIWKLMLPPNWCLGMVPP